MSTAAAQPDPGRIMEALNAFQQTEALKAAIELDVFTHIADGATTVMVIGEDQHAHQQAIKTGIRQDDKLQITEGLKEGQRIVTDGAYGLPDNAKVSVEAPAEEAKENEKPTAGKDSDSKDSTKDEKP